MSFQYARRRRRSPRVITVCASSARRFCISRSLARAASLILDHLSVNGFDLGRYTLLDLLEEFGLVLLALAKLLETVLHQFGGLVDGYLDLFLNLESTAQARTVSHR